MMLNVVSPCKACDRRYLDKNDPICVHCARRAELSRIMLLDDLCIPMTQKEAITVETLLKPEPIKPEPITPEPITPEPAKPEPGITHYVCHSCHVRKPIDQFPTNRAKRNGIDTQYKVCKSAYQKNRQEKLRKQRRTGTPVPRIATHPSPDAADAPERAIPMENPSSVPGIAIFPDIMAWIEKRAKFEFRTPELQVNYLLHQAMALTVSGQPGPSGDGA